MHCRSIIILPVVAGLLLLAVSVSYVEGSDCFECVHAEVQDFTNSEIEDWLNRIGIDADKSCKSGKSPKDDYSKTCKSFNGTSKVPCFKLYVDETVNEKKVKLTVRGCFPTYNTSFDGICNSMTSSELMRYFPSNESDYSTGQKALALVQSSVPGAGQIKGNVCFCEGDDCNSAISVNPFHASLIVGLGLVSYFFSRSS